VSQTFEGDLSFCLWVDLAGGWVCVYLLIQDGDR
jgi:hypothetical protein